MKLLGNRLSTLDTRRVKPAPKTANPELLTREHREWRAIVLANAGHRCEALANGKRCPRTEPFFKLYADHIVEREDGGALLDPSNGQALCAAHHTLKSARARAARHGLVQPQL